MVFASVNFYRYLWREKLGSKIIVIFYILVALLCITHIIFFGYLTAAPTTSPFLYDSDAANNKIIKSMESVGSCVMLSLGWLVAATMY